MTKGVLGRERVFHDRWAEDIDIDEVMVDESFEACTAPENRIIIKRLDNIKGKKILDIGCGAGEASVYFAKKGAHVTAIDISEAMLSVAERVARRHNVYIDTKISSSEDIGFPDETFDIVYASNLLHHVDIEPTLREVNRVLKMGGIFASWDPIAHNPLINIYRRMATEVRTRDEHPIRMNDLKIFYRYFSDVKTEMTWFFTLLIFIKFYLLDRVHPNEERYWKKILREHKKLEKIYSRLERMDRVFLRLFPFLRRYCWNIVIIARK
ncbi:MAG: class I SAM-dependent methyltransferase [Candidatus Nitrosotenuis sp.]